MFVPIVMDPCAFYDYRYLWEYLKNLYHCYQNGWPIIAAGEYRHYRERRPKSNVYDREFCSLHQYELLTKAQEDAVGRYFIPEELFRHLAREKGSVLASKIFLLQHRYPPLEMALHVIFKQIKKRYREPVEGILTWGAHAKSVDHIAECLGIPVISNEFCIRFPEFYPLSYFCRRDIYGQAEIRSAYRKFQKGKKNIPVRLLTRKELLALFLSPKRLYMIGQESRRVPRYEMGIAGCHPLIATFFARSMYTDLELIQDVRNVYRENEIVFRMHPGDEPYQARYTVSNQDDSQYASDFLLQCRRVTAQGSNMLAEAMLWGRQVYSRDVSPFTFLCEKKIYHKSGGVVSAEDLNFIFLTYLIPYRNVWDGDYIRWRLCEEQAENVYMNNLQYYLEEQGIPLSVMYLEKGQRLGQMIAYRRKAEKNGTEI